jgi:NuA3 HAT complex component NTO1
VSGRALFAFAKSSVPHVERQRVLMRSLASYDNKDVFRQGFAEVQKKMEERYYTTTLAFAHDLCEAVNVGINTADEEAFSDAQQPKADGLQISPSKGGQGEAGVRKRLAKRIFQYVKGPLLAALRAERDLSQKPMETLVKELEGMIEASLEVRQQPATAPAAAEGEIAQDAEANGDAEGSNMDGNNDVIMADAPDGEQITVARALHEDEALSHPAAEAPTHQPVLDTDAMDVDDVPGQPIETGAGEKAETKGLPGKGTAATYGLPSASVSVAGEGDLEPSNAVALEENGVRQSNTSPTSNNPPNGFPPPPPETTSAVVPSVQINGAGALLPLTPPQSHGSLNLNLGQAHPQEGSVGDVLSEGGIPWYLQSFDLRGTTAAEEKWHGRDALRSLSEELTDMDDDELRGLEFDVDDEAGTIMAMGVSGPASQERAAEEAEEEEEFTPKGTRRTRQDASGGTLHRKTRSGQLASGKARKGLRSSGRKR